MNKYNIRLSEMYFDKKKVQIDDKTKHYHALAYTLSITLSLVVFGGMAYCLQTSDSTVNKCYSHFAVLDYLTVLLPTSN